MADPTRRAFLAALAAPCLARAHPAHGGAGAEVLGVRREGAELLLRLSLHNDLSSAITLRGLRVSGAGGIALSRRVAILGLSASRPVDFLRLDPGERVTVGEGGTRLAIRDPEPGLPTLGLLLDFGPDGVILLPVPVPTP